MGLNKEQILAVQDRKTEKVSTPEWGDDVYVRSLTGADRDKLIGLEEKDRFFSLLIIGALCDESGKSLGFTADDIPALAEKNLAVLVRIFNAASDLNGFGATAEIQGN